MKVLSKLGWNNYSLVEWLLFLIIFSYWAPWIVWAYRLSSILQYFFTLCAFAIFLKQGRFKKNGHFFVFCLLLLYFVVFQFANTVHLSYIPIAIAFLIATQITKKEGNNVVCLTTNYLFCGVIVSLPLWLFHQFVSPLPVFDIIDVSSWKSADRALFYENHIFFICAEGFEAMRFYSWFDEPGVLGTFSAFILWANNYNFKNFKVVTVFIGALFSFSMAFYILTIVGWLIYSRHSIKKLLITIAAMLVVGYSLLYYLQDNLAFQQEIVNRVINHEDSGVNSRIGVEIEHLWDQYGHSSEIVFGLGSGSLEKYGGVSKSYQCFLLELGYVVLLLVLVSYVVLMKRKSVEGFLTLLLFFLSFLQRPNLYTSFGFIMFACIVLKFEYDRQNNL